MCALCTMAQMWRSEHKFVELVLSLHLYVSFRAQTQILMIIQQMLSLPAEPSLNPYDYFNVCVCVHVHEYR